MNNDNTAFERRSGDLTHQEILALFEGAKGELHLYIERDQGTHKRAFQIIDVWDASAPERLVGWDIVTEGTIDTRLDEEGDWVTELAWAVLEECGDDWASITEFDDLIAGTNPAVVQG